MRHINTGRCPACQSKLVHCDERLQKFFTAFQMGLPTVHVSWGFRSQQEQNEAYDSGHSRLQWPESKHNAQPALAIDCFELDGNGMAHWSPEWFGAHLAPAARAAGLVWGGDWVSFKDFSHVETKD